MTFPAYATICRSRKFRQHLRTGKGSFHTIPDKTCHSAIDPEAVVEA